MAEPIYYVCKYTPLELLRGCGLETECLDPAPVSFECADGCAHPNLCGYGKAVIEEVAARGIKRLLLVDCCDVCLRVYDVLKQHGGMEFLFLLALPHKNGKADTALMERELLRLKGDLEERLGCTFDGEGARRAWAQGLEAARGQALAAPHIRLTGAHGGALLLEAVRGRCTLPVQDDTCTGRRELPPPSPEAFALADYAAALLNQRRPCMRMQFRTEEEDENAVGVICHTVKFCDYYSFQYRHLKERKGKPLLKIETDCTPQSSGQLRTRLDAFNETLRMKGAGGAPQTGIRYAAGVDSGSASTDAVVLDGSRHIVGWAILPTGAGAASGAEKALGEALARAGLPRDELDAVVSTGYGRETIGLSCASVTEITCHAKGAHFLYPAARTVIDIGGQDSKVIRLDPEGNVENFVMNDKCAAGTGRFLEMMARTLELSLPEMSELGLRWKNDVAISSMCTVFAESEVVSLVAENTPPEDIIHGLNMAVAAKTASLVKRLGGVPAYVMTGGVARNQGVVQALEERLGAPIHIPEEAQLCGALGAALFALERG